ncbi:xylulokinase [soil metagenome]
MNLLGIDIGTSGCKAGIFDVDGNQVAFAKRSYDVIFSEGGGAELDSDEVIKKCFEAIKECTAKAVPGSVKALSISSQGEAFTAIGQDNEILCNGMVSSDSRSKPYINGLVEAIGEEKLYNITGHTAYPIFTVFKLLWLKVNRPDVWEKAKYFLCFEDLLVLRLGAEPVISWSLAGRTMLFDVRKHEWSDRILDELGLPKAKLATPMASGSIIGVVNKSLAYELGLPSDTVIVSGGHDQTCSSLGAGVTDEGVAMLATGTVECITAAFKTPVFTENLRKNNLCTYDYTIKDTYSSIAYNLTGGNILKWFVNEFGQKEIEESKLIGADPYKLVLSKMSPDPTGILVLPYFTSSGTPYFDTQTMGAIYGLRLTSSRGEILRALLEGVALEMRLNLEILQKSGYNIHELRAVGGGAKSLKWTQLKANVLNKKITTLNIKETGCYGAAMLACSAKFGIPVADIAKNWVKPAAFAEPNQQLSNWYANKFEKYKELYKALKNLSFVSYRNI